MNILIADHGQIPAHLYGGTERVIWGLGKELAAMGHQITYLVKAGSHCPFARVIELRTDTPLDPQIPEDTDLVHLNFPVSESLSKPFLLTNHGNRNHAEPFPLNTVFVSENHAARYGSKVFVHNGLDWDDYNKPNFNAQTNHFHFLGNAAWRVKNVRGAIDIIKRKPKSHLAVLGGNRFNFKMGMRFTFHPRIHFYGMVGGDKKYTLLQKSKGMLFPVLWHEPFGLALIESLYFGKPVFGTPYGSLPEIIGNSFGYLSNSSSEIIAAMDQLDNYNPKVLHDYAVDTFNAKKMAAAYFSLYEKVVNGENLNQSEPLLIEAAPRFLPWN